MASLQEKSPPDELFLLAEHLRAVLSRWVRTTRDRTGTPSTAKIETLRLLQDAGSSSIAALAQGRQVKHQSMRLVVEQLEAEGAVAKSVDPNDRRSQVVHITSKGQSIVSQEQRTRTKWIATLLGSCSPAEQERVAGAIRTLESLLLKSTEGSD